MTRRKSKIQAHRSRRTAEIPNSTSAIGSSCTSITKCHSQNALRAGQDGSSTGSRSQVSLRIALACQSLSLPANAMLSVISFWMVIALFAQMATSTCFSPLRGVALTLALRYRSTQPRDCHQHAPDAGGGKVRVLVLLSLLT